MGHLSTTRDTGRLALEPGLQRLAGTGSVFSTAKTHPYVAQFRGVIGTFTQDGVAIDASVLFPDLFTGSNGSGDGIGFCNFLGFDRAVHHQPYENYKEKDGSAVENISGRGFRQCLGHGLSSD